MCDDMKFCIHILEAFKMFQTTPTNKSHQSGVRDSIDCPKDTDLPLHLFLSSVFAMVVLKKLLAKLSVT